MASEELEEKINKIRLKNEEIRRRYEEVEADKKDAAKQNALVQMVPSDNWPERKEPPEFSAPPKNVQKQKSLNKEHNDRLPQHYSSIQDRLGKKDHKFTQGDGPPPDPKYNFLADSEREMRAGDDGRADEEKNKNRNKASRGGPRRRGGGGGGGSGNGGGSREAFFKDNRGPQAFHSKEESLPEYEAWRAERNRIDEARINRQKTAEGNWRREWDSNKTNIEKDSSRKGDSNRKDSNMYERRNNHYDSDYSNRGHGGSRTYHGSQKNHGHQDYRRPHHEQSHEYKRQPDNKPPLSPTDDRTVTASDKSIKVTVNPANQPKGPVMSVKVNSPSIAGTGRVGPRQKSRITYSQSDAERTNQEYNNFSRQKSFDEKTAGANFNNGPRSAPKSPFTQRKKEGNSKSPYPQKKEFRNDESSARSKNTTKSMYPQKIESKEQRHTNNSASKPQRNQKRHHKIAGDKLENIAISNDNALPLEYQPDNSLNSTTDLKVNDNDNIENVSSIVNVNDQGSPEESKSLDSSVIAEKTTNEIVCNYSTEYANYENKENNDSIKEKHDQEETDLNDDDVDGNNPSNKTLIEGSQNNDLNLVLKEKEDESQTVSEPATEANQNLDLSNNIQQIILQNIAVEQDSTISAETETEAVSSKFKDNIQEAKQTFSKEDIQSPTLETSVEEIKLINDQENNSEQIVHDNDQKLGSQLDEDFKLQEANTINLHEKKSVNQEKNKLETIDNGEVEPTDIKNESIKVDESKSAELVETSQNELINDSGIKDTSFVNESIELNNTETTEPSSSQNTSANDSGIVDDSIEEKTIQTVTPLDPIIIPDAKNNVGNVITESMKSDFVEPTKEICEKTAEICDISSAASSETSETVKDYTKTNDNNEEVNETLENPTKDSGVDVVKDVNKIESSQLTDLQKEILSEKENPKTEESTKVATE